MPAIRKPAVSTFPLRLMSSVRRDVEKFSFLEGVSLNQFINTAVVEKLAHLQHEEWLRRRPKATAPDKAESGRLTEEYCREQKKKRGGRPSKAATSNGSKSRT